MVSMNYNNNWKIKLIPNGLFTKGKHDIKIIYYVSRKFYKVTYERNQAEGREINKM